jgi:hypothetical protein
MTSKSTWSQLHDATLIRIALLWEEGKFIVQLRTGSPSFPQVQILAVRGQYLECPRRHPWGESVSINEIRGPLHTANGSKRLEIEMQSGDVIVLEAEEFQLNSVELQSDKKMAVNILNDTDRGDI